MIEQEKCK